jgi:hypothetical protein
VIATPELSAVARPFANALLRRWPDIRATMRILPGGDFEATIRALARARAQALVCLTHGPDVWIRLKPPQTFYPVSSPRELLRLVSAITRDRAFIAVLNQGKKWSGTTLVKSGCLPDIQPGESCAIYSWSGAHDLDIARPPLRRRSSKARTT